MDILALASFIALVILWLAAPTKPTVAEISKDERAAA